MNRRKVVIYAIYMLVISIFLMAFSLARYFISIKSDDADKLSLVVYKADLKFGDIIYPKSTQTVSSELIANTADPDTLVENSSLMNYALFPFSIENVSEAILGTADMTYTLRVLINFDDLSIIERLKIDNNSVKNSPLVKALSAELVLKGKGVNPDVVVNEVANGVSLQGTMIYNDESGWVFGFIQEKLVKGILDSYELKISFGGYRKEELFANNGINITVEVYGEQRVPFS